MSVKQYYAHLARDGRKQTVMDHSWERQNVQPRACRVLVLKRLLILLGYFMIWGNSPRRFRHIWKRMIRVNEAV